MKCIPDSTRNLVGVANYLTNWLQNLCNAQQGEFYMHMHASPFQAL